MLLRQQGCGYEYGNLFTILHGFEGRPNSDLRFTKADVPGDQAIHGDFLLHIRLNLVNSGELVGSLIIRKRFLKFPLPGSIF